MSILCDWSIDQMIKSGRFGCDPKPTENQIQPASLDVRLGQEFINYNTDEKFKLDDGDTLTIEPGGCYLAETVEYVKVPNNLAIQVTGRSSVGRKFTTVHVTAGWLDPGFEGTVTLEMCNMSKKPCKLRIGQRVGQLVFFQMDGKAENHYGEKEDAKYQGQRGPTESRLEE